MSRQMERAENMARILGVTSNLVLFGTDEGLDQNLRAPLSITETEDTYRERHDKLTLPGLIDRVVFVGSVLDVHGARREEPLVHL